MEVHVTAELAKKLKDLADATGREPDELVEDAVAAYFQELSTLRETLDTRYDDLKAGKVQPIDGEEAFRRLREKSKHRRSRSA